jgi:hypothetical protein
MTRASLSGARGSIAKIAVVGVFFGLPLAAVSIPAYAAPTGTPTVLPAPLPADPATNAPAPPPPPPSQTAYTDDWWGYASDGGGGGAGGG